MFAYINTSPGKLDKPSSLGFWNGNESPNPGQLTKSSFNEQEEQVDLILLANNRVKLKESKQLDKYLKLDRQLKKNDWT